jgi:3-oxoacyl-[acyl-carrier-protein] synthase III
VLSNADLATFLDTDDDWITSRTGIVERRVSHVSLAEMALRRLGARPRMRRAHRRRSRSDRVRLDELRRPVPQHGPGLQARLGASGCAAMDINTACTSFLYGLSTATAMIRSGVVRRALVVGAEIISPFMDWNDRNVAVLFGDGAAAVVVEAVDDAQGVLLEKLGCYGDAREILRIHGMGGAYANQGRILGDTSWQFEGQEIFKKAVMGMGGACEDVLARAGLGPERIDLVDPAPGEPAHHRIRREAHRRADGSRLRQRAALRQHVGSHGAGRTVRSAGRRPHRPGRDAAGASLRRRVDVLCAPDPLGRTHTPRDGSGGRAAAL